MLKLKRNVLLPMLLLCALVCAPLAALASGTVTVIQAGDNVFNLVASGLNAPAGYDVILNFDGSRLSNPRVTLGNTASGALLAVNAGSGTVHIGVIKPTAMNGSGVVATITFDRSGDSPGAISITKGTAVSERGADLRAGFFGWSPSDAVAQAPADTPAATPAAATASQADGSAVTPAATATAATATATTPGTSTPPPTGSSAPHVTGTLTIASDDSVARELQEAAGQAEPVQEARDSAVPEPAAVAVAAVPAEAQTTAKKAKGDVFRPVPSVLEKFRRFSGEKTPKTLTALFDREQGAPFSQVPAICIADGKASVQIMIPKLSGDKAPNFTFDHASYLAVQETAEGGLLLEVRPDQDAAKASINMLVDDNRQEIPLTVSPQADVCLTQAGTVTEADFLLFLKTRGTEGAPKFDLNGDGKRDYQDDYIFTANYLVMKAGKDKN